MWDFDFHDAKLIGSGKRTKATFLRYPSTERFRPPFTTSFSPVNRTSKRGNLRLRSLGRGELDTEMHEVFPYGYTTSKTDLCTSTNLEFPGTSGWTRSGPLEHGPYRTECPRPTPVFQAKKDANPLRGRPRVPCGLTPSDLSERSSALAPGPFTWVRSTSKKVLSRRGFVRNCQSGSLSMTTLSNVC